MSSLRRLIINSVSMFVARGIQPILSLMLALVIGRTLGPELFGQYMLIFQLYFIFQMTSAFGLRILLTREIAAQRDKVYIYLSNGVLLGLFASFINISIMILAVLLLDYEGEIAKGAYIISISVFASSLFEIFSGILAGYEKIKNIAYSWIYFLALKTVLSVIFLLLGYGLISIIIIHVITKFLQVGLGYYYITRSIGRPKIQIDIRLCKKMINMAWSLGLLIICISIFWRIDAIMLSKMTSDEIVGNYGAAFKIFHVALLALRSFFLAFFPMLSLLYTERRSDFQKACRKAIRYLIMLSLPLSLFFSVLAPRMMTLVWGPEFSDSIIVLQVIIWSLIPFAITEVFGNALVASKNQVVHLILNAITLLIKFILNYFLILKYGIYGPAIATLISLSLLGFMQIPFVIPKLVPFKTQTLMIPLVKIIIAFILMGFVIFLFNPINMEIGLLCAGVVYLVSLLVFKILSDEDKIYFNKMIRKTSKI